MLPVAPTWRGGEVGHRQRFLRTGADYTGTPPPAAKSPMSCGPPTPQCPEKAQHVPVANSPAKPPSWITGARKFPRLEMGYHNPGPETTFASWTLAYHLHSGG
ncbi:hypothetical protein HPB52_019473 [Rhipicephalus sanguineus]|uniref:Uncharacterized protein n=1 Tax=Rhipicephalus sanguineus TaxID=34632 RepID=A0A9D4PDL4_RHISA|nr:hypothetical protein HPB52_019473 [Rhipicephalus sanguineus]